MAEEITVGGITVPLTHPDKVLFPGDGITKADLARYHADVAGVMLPWISDRLAPGQFTRAAVRARIGGDPECQDPWAGFAGAARGLGAASKRG